ncbi:signal recognition particle-docking protein FtsY [Candidatus Erwinia haradaeae]|uniref:Signal recognition particle receptor FtsY n=1 Tax=Candidatus Erwinia haradaeae TaxID=1922217 RepID=A0A803GC81_9GAMM|nr:signal recognition particle-docking protein FtsY [Candidatus Erwinia haradaeae]VFP87374.1 Signal recognition particle receptor FtsY [Candidatus Erwinia haradaeae]
MFKNKQSTLLKWIGLGKKKSINLDKDKSENISSFKVLCEEQNQDNRLDNFSKHKEKESSVISTEVIELKDQRVYSDLQYLVENQSIQTPQFNTLDACIKTTIDTDHSSFSQNNIKESTTSTIEKYALHNSSDVEFKEKHSIKDSLITGLESDQIKKTEYFYKVGFFNRLKSRLNRTRVHLGIGFRHLFRESKIDRSFFEKLEEKLLLSDVGVDTTQRLISTLEIGIRDKKCTNAEELYLYLKSSMREILSKVEEPLNIIKKMPFVILMIGVNGAGKTTTIGKLAQKFQMRGQSVILAAGDTFRAGAIDQLEVWGERNNISVVSNHVGSDSASVIFDAMHASKARQTDILIADTAGRLQNKTPLIEEVKKIIRVIKKVDISAPHEIMLIIDASTGQNAINQTKLFNKHLGVTGITLTKLDSTAKGGVIFTLADQFNIPIRYIGIGEGIEDLREFQSEDFIKALFL